MTPNPTNFSTASIPDLAGRVFIVTGGNTGIGYETCLQLAKKNATVVMASRSQERANAAIEKIKAEIPGYTNIEFLKLVLNDLKQVSSAALEIAQRHPTIDVLINNAGIMASPFALSPDGIEDQFATNHVGHFLFTRHLLPCLLKSSHARIVNLSSSYHDKAPTPEGIRFNAINDPKSMDVWQRYGQSKLSNILFSKQLNKLYGDRIFINSVHPGFVDTELMRGPEATYGEWLKPIFKAVKYFAALTPEQGALTQLYAAASPEIVEKGLKDRFFVPIAKDATETAELTALGKDDALAKELWDFTEALLKEKGF
ncbi:hypothetical protein BJ741DRAFT_590617 [Chytriomyces cf. hyalinus JEL632]|nr:hypothetical protein BJ741DRAFT_590617 [Chytriomyces cf. hyalinus JEL632]